VATVAITVTSANDAPVAANDSYTTAEDTVLNMSARRAGQRSWDLLSLKVGSATVSSYNAFKKDPGVRGWRESQLTTFSVPGATAALKNANGTVLGTGVSDQDGWCHFNCKSSAKAVTFYVTLTPPAGFGTAQTKAITLNPNGDVEVDFTAP
jgi:hypothetical protein